MFLDNPATVWVLIPLAAISIAPFKMWLRVKEKQISSQSNLAAEKSAQYAQHMDRSKLACGCSSRSSRMAALKPRRRSKP